MAETFAFGQAQTDASSIKPGTTIKSQPTFDGPQLWINHDARHRNSRPHRHQVFSHIQRNYRPWRRTQRDKSLQNPPGMHDTTDDERPTSPTTLLTKGNSDPFGVYPVGIGPEENELVSFYRDVFLPAQYAEVGPNPQMGELRAIDWEKCIGGLTDEGVGYALLARWGQIAGRCTPFVRKAAFAHQYRGTRLLRSKIVQGKDLQNENDYMHISHLFSAETAGRNAPGALAHANMLRNMLQQAWEQGTLSHKLLTWQIHQDMQRAVIFLSPPVFDVDEWVPRVFAPLKQSIVVEIPPLDRTSAKLDRSIESSTLANLFQQARAYWEFRKTREQDPTRYILQDSLTWHAVEEFLIVGRFVNYYVNVKKRLEGEYVSKKVKRELLVQQYLSLAAIYLLKSVNLNPAIFGIPIFDAAPAVLPALRKCLEDSEEISNLVRGKNYKNARLWALYVGSVAEQSFPQVGGLVSDPCGQWFNMQLARQASAMELHHWTEVKPILMRFLYTDREGPLNGEIWFDRTMGWYLRNRSTAF